MANFWKQFQLPNAIEEILNKESYTLQELLDEDEVIGETKSHREDLIRFFIKPENIDQLVRYVVDDPSPNANENEMLRYPAIATEILCSSQHDIEDALIPAEDVISNKYLTMIYNFYATPTINLQKAALVAKVAIQLLKSKHSESLSYLHHHPECIHNILLHIESASVPAYFIRLINLEFEDSGKGTLDWLLKIDFPEKILNKFRPEYSLTHSDSVTFILEIFGVLSTNSVLMREFLSLERGSQLLGLMLLSDNHSAFRYGMPVFLHLVKTIGNSFVYDSDGEEHHNRVTPSSPLNALPGVVGVLIQALPIFSELLVNPTDATQAAAVSGVDNPFGWQRLRILQILSTLLSLEFKVVRTSLLDSEIFRISIEQFFRFPQNNFGHQAVEKLFSQILELVDGEARVKFIQKTNIIPLLINAELENTSEENSGKLRRPYMPYIHQMSFSIMRYSENDEALKAILEGVEGWSNHIKSLIEFKEKSVSAYPAPPRNIFFGGRNLQGYPMF